VQHVRVDHDPQRQLLQVHQLRHNEWLRVSRRVRDEPLELVSRFESRRSGKKLR
jgi:hypothetical protein